MSMLEPPKLKERFIFAVVEEHVYGLPRAPPAVLRTSPCTYGQGFEHYRTGR